NGVHGGGGARKQERDHGKKNQNINTTGEELHTASRGWVCTTVTVSQETCCELQHARKLLNKSRLRNIMRSGPEALSMIMTLEWAFCHSIVGELGWNARFSPKSALVVMPSYPLSRAECVGYAPQPVWRGTCI